MRYVAPPGEAAVRQPVISPQIVFGVDVGQAADHSAIVVVERGGKDTGRKVRQQYWDSHFDEWSTRMVPEQVPVHHVRHIERLPLGTSYVDQAARVTEMVTRLEGVNDRPMVVV